MTPDGELELQELGPISKLAHNMLQYAKKLSPMYYVKHFVPTLKNRSDITPEEFKSAEFTRKRAAAIEYYLVVWLIVAALFTVAVLIVHPNIYLMLICYFFATIRIIEIMQVTVNVTVFDRYAGRPDNIIASSARVLVLAATNFIELAIWFGMLYALGIDRLTGAGQPATAFYLSFMTQSTIGYSNVYPTGYLRIIAAIQGLVAILFLVLVLARIVTALPPMNVFRNNKHDRKT